mmetsp:Transcript_40115/g.100750  ORF Transcript_40115/g.100750 Transcript_40115/m.100750 type:complete len:245 (+) Transcript_40115:609-1343(+)
MQPDDTTLVHVHRQERCPYLGTLLVGKRPRHHRHADPLKLRGCSEIRQIVNDRCPCTHGHLLRDAVGAAPRDDPCVRQGLGGAQPLRRIDRQQREHELTRGVRKARPHFVLDVHISALYLPLDLLCALARKRRVAHQKDEHDHAQGPQVTLVVVTGVQHLGRHVRCRAATQLHLLVRVFVEPTEAEVDQLEERVVLRVVQEVFRLDVSMHDALTMEVIYRQQHHPRGLCSVALAEGRLTLNTLE